MRDEKLFALSESKPDIIMTANIGCQSHLGSGTEISVKHWIEVLADALHERGTAVEDE